ncbi:MAG: ABC transporter ATP-binding protein [Streptomycetaceae bacterium]|jgi:multiple sugar transport system ATP-binding protein|nr:MAG: ABC transporter ATP-binding protein [Streptomycetaceae bacterium]
MSVVKIEKITKVFAGGVRALDGLDLTINDGEFFALLGPSGCGKTTLLRTLGGLEAPTSGAISIDEKDVTWVSPGARNIAMVFQDYALYPHMNVRDNISYPLKVKKFSKEEIEKRVSHAAKALSIESLLERRPGQISGGQQQRVAVARAMACTPNLYLFDEPLSNLDARLRLEARTFLKQLQRELGVTTILVTHDQSEALALADRMAVMDKGQIKQIGSPAEFFHRPQNTFVAAFIGSTPMNLLDGVIKSSAVQVGANTFAIPALAQGKVSEGQEVVFGVRPEYVTLSSAAGIGIATGAVKVTENLGTHYLVSAECNGILFRGTVPDGNEPKLGSIVHLTPEASRTLLYDKTSGNLI